MRPGWRAEQTDDRSVDPPHLRSAVRSLFRSWGGAVVSVALLWSVVADHQDAQARQAVQAVQAVQDGSDASLASLSLAGVDLALGPAQSQFWVAYGGAAPRPTIVAVATQPGAQVAYSPADADPDTAGYQTSLSHLRVVRVTVTSPDGTAERRYWLWLYDYRLDALGVEGFDIGFDPATAAYGLEVPHSTATVTLTADAASHIFAYSHPDADPATGGHQVALQQGENTVTVTATPRPNIIAVPQTYTITVTRLPGDSVAGPSPLTASFTGVPRRHSGRDFGLFLRFSEEVSTSFDAMRFWTIRVIGGRLQHAWQPDPDTTVVWRLHLVPFGDYDVTVSVQAGQTCGEVATVCTADGKALSHDVEVTVNGPNGSATHPSVAASEVYLVFDDGPDPDVTPQVLDVLKRYGARATFFVTGANATAHPDVVQRAADEGHTFGNHTWDNDVLADLTSHEFNRTITRTQEALGDHATDCIRPPRNLADHKVVEGVQELGMRIIRYTVNTKDWQLPGAEAVADRIVWGAAPGSVITLHDVGDTGEQAAEALDLALARLAGSGLNFVPVCNPDPPATDPPATDPPATDPPATEPPQAPPSAPSSLTAAVNDDGHIVLSWNAAPDADAVTGYQILRRRPRMGERTLTVYVDDTGSAAATYTDTAAPAGTLYVYRVKAHNRAGTSARSNYVNVDRPA